MNYDESWLKITKAFPILIEKNEESESSEQDLEIAIKLINHLTINDHIEQLILINVEKEMRNDVVPKFWTKFKKVESPNERFKLFTEAVNELYDTISRYLPIFENIKKLRNGKSKCVYGKTDPLETFKIIVHSTLLSQLPLDYKEIVNSFYDISLRVFGDFNKSSVAEDGSICKHCNYEVENCQCRNIINNCHQINCKLIEMDLLERMVMQEVILLIYSRIENHVQETCKNNYDISFLCRLEDWLQTVVLSWLTQILCGSSSSTTDSLNEQMKDTIEKFKQKLTYFLHETYLKTIIDQLFYVIIEYPDSQPIIDDVRVCLPKTGLRSLLTSKLQQAFENRLLHQGVSTPDILTAYVTAIRALRRLDPTGVLLDTITEPVRKYLRSRDDTVRCIVSSLTEEGSSELADELVKGDALQLDDGCASDDENENWKTWMPDPIDADPTKTSKARRTSDIISMLVNVFGSKELFVNEYRTLLADRLLSQATCNTEKEIRYLELLKLRFGDSQLHYCEVMLKDIYDSKRINANLQNDSDYMAKKKEFPSTAMILSAQFWPPFKDDSLELLPEVKEQLDIYTKGFEALKGNRTLCWKTHLGTVDLEIELKDRTLNLSVSPMLATIIMHFQNKNEWTIEELYHSMKTPPVILRRKMAYWQTHGIIREENNKFILIEEEPDKNKGVPMTEMMCEEDETESAMASAHDQREEELQVFWSYIVGMLTNLEALPLDRIHQMLKMFASSEGPTAIECSMQELRTFLDGKVREHKLLFIGRYYRLP